MSFFCQDVLKNVRLKSARSKHQPRCSFLGHMPMGHLTPCIKNQWAIKGFAWAIERQHVLVGHEHNHDTHLTVLAVKKKNKQTCFYLKWSEAAGCSENRFMIIDVGRGSGDRGWVGGGITLRPLTQYLRCHFSIYCAQWSRVRSSNHKLTADSPL